MTGGLPYFGGPGNNYVTHAIAEMVQRVRGQPGSYGLVMANGGLVTKEAVGIYSTMRPEKSFVRESASLIQDQIDRMPKQELDHEPRGEAVIETYAVLHGKSGPERCVLFGKLVSTGARFLANTPGDAQTLATMQSSEGLGLRGQVSREGDINVFVPAS